MHCRLVVEAVLLKEQGNPRYHGRPHTNAHHQRRSRHGKRMLGDGHACGKGVGKMAYKRG